MSGDITIESYDGFNQTINQLDSANQEIAAKYSASDEATTAVASAASNGHGGAPIFTGTLAALEKVTGDIKSHIETAKTSVSTAVSDMQTLSHGMQAIDEGGAHQVTTT